MGWRPVEWAMVAREKHADGSNHLHLLVCLKKKVNIKRADALDFIGGKHGNYQSARNCVDIVKYLMKEGNYICHGFDAEQYVRDCKGKKRGRAFTEAAEFIKDGGTIADIDDQGFVCEHLGKLTAYKLWWDSFHPRHRVHGWSPRVIILWGRTGLGKSHWVLRGPGVVAEGAAAESVWQFPVQRPNQCWWDGYAGERLLLMDDYNPKTMQVQDLLKVCDKYPLKGLPVKSVTGGVTADWTEVVFTSNIDPKLWWPKLAQATWDAFYRRVHIRYVDDTSFRTKTFMELYDDMTWPEAPAFGARSDQLV